MASVDPPPPGKEFANCRCPICNELFSEPRLLPCAHLVCKDCLSQWLHAGDPASKCPLCQVGIFKGRGSGDSPQTLDDFPVDESMALTARRARSLLEETHCGNCPGSEAVVMCFDCDCKLCEDCREAHAKLKVLRNHVTLPLHELTPEAYARNSRLFCPTHADEPARLYCQTHRVAVCPSCDHATHRHCPDVTTVDDRMHAAKRVLTQLVERLLTAGSNLTNALQEVDKSMEDVQAESDACLAEVDAGCDRLRKAVEETRARVKKRVRDNCCRVLARRTEQRTVLARRRGMLNSSVEAVSRTLEVFPRHAPDSATSSLLRHSDRLDLTATTGLEDVDAVSVAVVLGQSDVDRIARDIEALGEDSNHTATAHLQAEQTQKVPMKKHASPSSHPPTSSSHNQQSAESSKPAETADTSKQQPPPSYEDVMKSTQPSDKDLSHNGSDPPAKAATESNRPPSPGVEAMQPTQRPSSPGVEAMQPTQRPSSPGVEAMQPTQWPPSPDVRIKQPTQRLPGPDVRAMQSTNFHLPAHMDASDNSSDSSAEVSTTSDFLSDDSATPSAASSPFSPENQPDAVFVMPPASKAPPSAPVNVPSGTPRSHSDDFSDNYAPFSGLPTSPSGYRMFTGPASLPSSTKIPAMSRREFKISQLEDLGRLEEARLRNDSLFTGRPSQRGVIRLPTFVNHSRSTPPRKSRWTSVSTKGTFTFHHNNGGMIKFSSNMVEASFQGKAWGGGIMLCGDPMKCNTLYEVLVMKTTDRTCTLTVGVVVTDRVSTLDIPAGSASWRSAVSISPDVVSVRGEQVNWDMGKALGQLSAGSTVGVLMDFSGGLHLFVDGRDHGVAAEGLPDNRHCHAFFELTFMHGCTKISSQPLKLLKEIETFSCPQ
ncbi:uncharacterized protein LOC143296971 isoform X2 [Babylonia areolata]|uniref:uncharacterized protein LOC143296971 isoform X2 n=1 Tax=Babylonia areolata TaxID=304850 RepID=UPI003FD23BAD